MKIISNKLPKKLLFLITLIFAIAPACTKRQKMAAANGAVAAGTISTAAGITALGLGTTVTCFCAGFGGFIAAGPVAFTVLVPGFLIGAGIAGIVKGVQKRKKLKQQKLLETKKFEQEQQESEEIPNIAQGEVSTQVAIKICTEEQKLSDLD